MKREPFPTEKLPQQHVSFDISADLVILIYLRLWNNAEIFCVQIFRTILQTRLNVNCAAKLGKI